MKEDPWQPVPTFSTVETVKTVPKKNDQLQKNQVQISIKVNEGLKEIATDIVMKLKYGKEGMIIKKTSLSSIQGPLIFTELIEDIKSVSNGELELSAEKSRFLCGAAPIA